MITEWLVPSLLCGYHIERSSASGLLMELHKVISEVYVTVANLGMKTLGIKLCLGTKTSSSNPGVWILEERYYPN